MVILLKSLSSEVRFLFVCVCSLLNKPTVPFEERHTPAHRDRHAQLPSIRARGHSSPQLPVGRPAHTARPRDATPPGPDREASARAAPRNALPRVHRGRAHLDSGKQGSTPGGEPRSARTYRLMMEAAPHNSAVTWSWKPANGLAVETGRGGAWRGLQRPVG